MADDIQKMDRQRVKLAEARGALRKKIADLRARAQRQPVEPAPRYDEVFFDGTAWLDQQ